MFINKEKPHTLLLADFGEGQANAPDAYERKKLETVVTEHGGRVLDSAPYRVFAAFKRPDAAFEAARELHGIPAGSPPVPPRLSVHAGKITLEDRSAAGAPVSAVLLLAEMASEKHILCTGSVYKELSSSWQTQLLPLSQASPLPDPEETLHVLPWEQEDRTRMVTMMWGNQELTRGQIHLELTYRGKQVNVSEAQPAIIVGRSSQCDLVVNHKLASRLHARIEYRNGNFVLVDQSGNGTFVAFGDGDKRKVHMNSLPIRGTGRIGLGDQSDALSDDAIQFVCVE
ncbi:MAG TPA: FHA domain-containing protein [Gammaproteobacteria bacterium]|nr:FHA domain-containing protein [Gammaproteobacteria bacterium]